MQDKYLDDLKDIKDIMNRSSRFISLSGLSGISAGLIALIGAYAAYQTVFNDRRFSGYEMVAIPGDVITRLLVIAIGTLVLAIGAGIYFTVRETKRRNLKAWDNQTRRLLLNLAIPLAAGGILGLMLLNKGYIGLVAPLTLIFYGLALVNASKYTLDEIRSLGVLEVVLGLVAMQFIGYGLLFWAIGFGLLHIIYGVVMQMKDRS